MRSNTNHPPLGLSLASNGASSLQNIIAHVQLECLRMKNELREAHSELARLRQQKARPAAPCSLTTFDFRALRRQVAYFCHPDRGGDDSVMRQLNAIFDYLDSPTASSPTEERSTIHDHR